MSKRNGGDAVDVFFVHDADFRVYMEAEEIENRRAERVARRKRVAKQRRFLLAALFTTIAFMCLTVATHSVAVGTIGPKTPAAFAAVASTAPDTSPVLPEPLDGREDPLESEKIEAALLEQGYFSDAVPLPYDLQDFMRTACVQYDCPYAFALAVADWETRGTFDMDAVGAVGEVGIMQLNPGPGGAYHRELMEATGQDPTTPGGNIVCGVYLLGKYLDKYEDPAKAAMAYNMGEGGARKAWSAGITSTEYSAAVLTAAEQWETVVGQYEDNRTASCKK